MYNENNFSEKQKVPYQNTRMGRSVPEGIFDVPPMQSRTRENKYMGDYPQDSMQENRQGRRCDGSMPSREGNCQGGRNRQNQINHQSAGDSYSHHHAHQHDRHLHEFPLAMVYSPYQTWRNLYSSEKAIMRGTLFSELDLPLEVTQKERC